MFIRLRRKPQVCLGMPVLRSSSATATEDGNANRGATADVTPWSWRITPRSRLLAKGGYFDNGTPGLPWGVHFFGAYRLPLTHYFQRK